MTELELLDPKRRIWSVVTRASLLATRASVLFSVWAVSAVFVAGDITQNSITKDLMRNRNYIHPQIER